MADIAIFPTCCCCEYAEMWTTLADQKKKYRNLNLTEQELKKKLKIN